MNLIIMGRNLSKFVKSKYFLMYSFLKIISVNLCMTTIPYMFHNVTVPKETITVVFDGFFDSIVDGFVNSFVDVGCVEVSGRSGYFITVQLIR